MNIQWSELWSCTFFRRQWFRFATQSGIISIWILHHDLNMHLKMWWMMMIHQEQTLQQIWNLEFLLNGQWIDFNHIHHKYNIIGTIGWKEKFDPQSQMHRKRAFISCDFWLKNVGNFYISSDIPIATYFFSRVACYLIHVCGTLYSLDFHS